MATRSETPGLQRRKRKGGAALAWSAAALSKADAKRYPDRWIPLPRGATAAEVRELCELYTARFEAWRHRGPAPRCLYDGTIGSLCDAFERHPASPMLEVRESTAAAYLDSLKVLRSTVAARAVRAVAPIDVKTWYAKWRAPRPKKPDDPDQSPGPERVKRAHDAVAMLRAILGFGQALGHDECARLLDGLSRIRFERAARRNGAMTVEHVEAFVAKATARGDQRGLSMAIGIAAQFETLLRQIDVIGEWRRDADGKETWSGPFRWDNIPAGILRLTTSKTGSPIVHDLTRLDLLWPLIQRVPQIDRTGAIVKAYGEPIRAKSYRKWFREIAREAGIPDDVWSMDARAGGVTEALEAGADLTAVSRAATHSEEIMTRRYDREVEAAVADVAAARKRGRAK